MVRPSKRWMKKKFKRISSQVTTEYYEGKKGVAHCAITGEKLSGTHTPTKGLASKKSKTQKRPSVPFGGNLGSKARTQVFEEVGKIKADIKTIDDVEQKYRTFVKQAMKRAE